MTREYNYFRRIFPLPLKSKAIISGKQVSKDERKLPFFFQNVRSEGDRRSLLL